MGHEIQIKNFEIIQSTETLGLEIFESIAIQNGS